MNNKKVYIFIYLCYIKKIFQIVTLSKNFSFFLFEKKYNEFNNELNVNIILFNCNKLKISFFIILIE
jgi:hypothetical protein